ncbi:FAD-binding oxidoreductase [Brevibacterium pityocampae]|uniref:FAD-binding oxidoreductase n=1 Tax=Brevibacterium pityocampae TaxID=506594 RepID=A0ABP8JP47_9MICO
MHIAVIGAGVLGLCTALHLAERGEDVVLLEAAHPFAGASGRSFAWINANHKEPRAYYDLNAAGIAAHHRLQERLAAHGRWFHPSGGILVDTGPDRIRTYEERSTEARAYGYPCREVDRAELEALEPAVDWPDSADGGLLFEAEGYADAELFRDALLSALADRGIAPRIITVESWQAAGDGVDLHLAGGEVLSVDRAVLAAGAASREIAARSGALVSVADLRERSARTHSFLGITEPVGTPPLDIELHRVIVSDRMNVRPQHDGRLLVQVPSVEHRAAEQSTAEQLAEVRAEMDAVLAEFFGDRARLESVTLSGRSLPDDELTIAGFLDEQQRVYALVTHSGMTLAPHLGEVAAAEVTGTPDPGLELFRPGRFARRRAQADGAGDGEATAGTREEFIGRQ